MELIANCRAIRAYRDHFVAIVSLGIGKSPIGDLIIQMFCETERLRRKLVEGPYVGMLLAAQTTLRSCDILQAYVWLESHANCLRSVQGRLMPLPDFPLYRRRLATFASDFVLRVFAGTPYFDLVACILSHSDFSDENVRFRTMSNDGFLGIQGKNGTTFGDLLHLSHELGHCIYDSLLPENRSAKLVLVDLVSSETAAHIFEMWCAYTYARMDSDAISDLLQYLKTIDALNIYFFSRESSIILGRSHIVPQIFDDRAECLRESLHSYPGMQVAYALASSTRQNFYFSVEAGRLTPEVLRHGFDYTR